MKQTALKSIIVLSLICLVSTLLLAVTNQITAPIIEDAEKQAALDALKAVMPEGGDFTEIELPAGADAMVTNIWQAENGGYVIRLSTSGYASGLVIMCGIGSDGVITGVETVSSSETPGYGKACEEEWYQAQYTGVTSDLTGIDGITGATRTSTAYKNAIKTAFETFYDLTAVNGEEGQNA